MPNTSQKVRVHNAIISLLTSGPYYGVTYQSNKQANDIDINDVGTVAITPSSAQCNEINSAFSVDRSRGRARSFQREPWTWVGIVAFDQEVTAEFAEETWENPQILPSASGFRQATIQLVGSSYQHPTKQGGPSGSRIEFTFEVTLGRR